MCVCLINLISITVTDCLAVSFRFVYLRSRRWGWGPLLYRAQKIGQKRPFFRDVMSILSGLAQNAVPQLRPTLAIQALRRKSGPNTITVKKRYFSAGFHDFFGIFLLPHRLYACQIHLLQKESALFFMLEHCFTSSALWADLWSRACFAKPRFRRNHSKWA